MTEGIGFPIATQAAQLIRLHAGRNNDSVDLITDLTPAELPALRWLKANRQGWGIENGTHQRLDVTFNDDRCRVHGTNGLWLPGMAHRPVISLFRE